MKSGQLKLLLARAGVHPRKRKGQSFLINEEVVEREVEAARIEPGDTVLEIGPGLGILTKELCRRAGNVIAIEIEENFVRLLGQMLSHYDNLTVIQGDALKVDFPPFDRVVSNIPYSISAPLIFKLMDHSFKRGVFILQEEFARRLTAMPGMREYSRLSVMVQIKCQVEELFHVPKTNFYPQPEVNSTAVALTPFDEEVMPDIQDAAVFDAVVKAVFSHRRKKMKNCLEYGIRELGGSDRDIEHIMAILDEEILEYRGENLFPDEIVEIANTISQNLA